MAKRESEVRFVRSTRWVVLEGPAAECRDAMRPRMEALLEEVNAGLNKLVEGDTSRMGQAWDRALIDGTTAMEYLRMGSPLDALPFAIMARAWWILAECSDEEFDATADQAERGERPAPLVAAALVARDEWLKVHPYLTQWRPGRWQHDAMTAVGIPACVRPTPPGAPEPTTPMRPLVAGVAPKRAPRRPTRAPAPPPAGP